MPLVAAAARLAVPGAGPSADAELLLVPGNADVHVVDHHDSFTPRSASTSCRPRMLSRASTVALTRLIGLVEPKLLVKMSLMPAASQTARTAAPAMTPVPGAGRHEDHLRGAEPAVDRVRDGAPLQADRAEAAGGVLGRLVHGRRHFVGLAVAEAHAALAVADDDQGRETEPPAPLHHGGAAADAQHVLTI